MPSFVSVVREVAVGQQGRSRAETMTEQAALATSRKRDLLGISLQEASKKCRTRSRCVGLQDLVIYTRQLTTMIDARLAITRSLQVLAEQIANHAPQRVKKTPTLQFPYLCAMKSWPAIGLASVVLLGFLLAGCVSPPTMKAPPPSAASVGGTGFDRSAIAKPAPVKRAAVPDSTRARVVWVGIATTVSDAELPGRFPRLSQAAGLDNSIAPLILELESRIQAEFSRQSKFPGFDLVGQTDEQRPSDIGMALLINNERFWSEKTFEEDYRWEYGILGQVVFIDQQKQEICASYPIRSALLNVTGDPSTGQISAMVRSVLIGSSDSGTESNSFFGKFCETMRSANLSVRSDYCFEVGRVSVDPACSSPTVLNQGIKAFSFDSFEMSIWKSELGPVLVNHLGNSSGLVLNPYVSKADGKDNILALHFQKGASRIVQSDENLSLRLRPPVRRFDLAIKGLTSAIDPQLSGKFVVNLVFGFNGTLSVVEPVSKRVVLEHAFDISLGGFKTLPKELRDIYWQNARRKLLPSQFENGEYDGKYCWWNSIGNFLDQITREMLFEKADQGRRFGALRQDLEHITHSPTR